MQPQNTTDGAVEIIETDICIIGGGPAGLAVAQAFCGDAVRVLVVESGGEGRSDFADGLSDSDSVGAPRLKDGPLVRTRGLGGTTQVWSGRCAPFDEIDYEARHWVRGSGWPLKAADIEPYLGRASANLGLDPVLYDPSAWAKGLSLRWYDRREGRGDPPPREPLDDRALRPQFWQFSQDEANPKDWMRSGPWFRRRAGNNVRVLLNATVTELHTDPGGRAVKSATLSDPDHRLSTVYAKAFVLCGGGIENVRLLLASRSQYACGLGNQNDLVGRYFMDHPRAEYGSIEAKGSQRLQDRFCVHRLNTAGKTHHFLTGFALSPDYQRRTRRLNCSGWLILHPSADDPWGAAKRLRHREGDLATNLGAIAGNLGLVAKGAARLARRLPAPHKLDRISLFADVEQQPDPNSRITLSDRRDAFGVPLARIDWRINDLEKESIRALGLASQMEFGRLGLAQVELAPWIMGGRLDEAQFIDAGHPSGGTRMADDPKAGVVDAHGQVFGLGGLYVAGASVFPTNSHANPTLMVVAMAIRTAERIKAHLFASAPPNLQATTEPVS